MPPRSLSVLAAALWCVGAAVHCAEPTEAQAPLPAPSLEQRARAILSEPASEDEYGGATRCLRTSDFRRVEILDSKRLVFYGRGDARWLNQLPKPCPGLRRNDTLRFDMRSSRLCQHDGFGSVDPFGPSMGISCYLAQFEPVSPEQVEMLKDALRAEREGRPASED